MQQIHHHDRLPPQVQLLLALGVMQSLYSKSTGTHSVLYHASFVELARQLTALYTHHTRVTWGHTSDLQFDFFTVIALD